MPSRLVQGDVSSKRVCVFHHPIRARLGEREMHCAQTTRHRLTCHATKKKFSSFDDMVTGSDVPVLVDFYAAWCGPCLMMANVLEELAPSVRGKVAIVKIDTEKYPNLAARYGIQGLPTLCLFKNGKVVNRLEGFLSGPELLDRLTPFM